MYGRFETALVKIALKVQTEIKRYKMIAEFEGILLFSNSMNDVFYALSLGWVETRTIYTTT